DDGFAYSALHRSRRAEERSVIGRNPANRAAPLDYSALRASMGLMRVAFMAGRRPAARPITIDRIKAPATMPGSMAMGRAGTNSAAMMRNTTMAAIPDSPPARP